MSLFIRTEEAQVIVRRRGVFKQVPLYHRDGRIYARYSGGFIRLMTYAGTTHPDVRWEDIYDPRRELIWSETSAPALRMKVREAA